MPTYIVVGFPGTGKTTYLFAVIACLLSQGVHPERICFNSFTRAAAGVAIQRAREKFPDYTRKDFYNFRTLHSQCARLQHLDKERFVTDKILTDFCKDLNYYYNSHLTAEDNPYEWIQGPNESLAQAFFQFNSYVNHTQLSIHRAWSQFSQGRNQNQQVSLSQAQDFLKAYRGFKEEHNLLDYDDILLTALQKQLVPEVEFLLVDEFQDFSPLMYKIFCHWEKEIGNVIIAGDPFQAIYTFMGADPSLIQDHPAEQKIVLPRSYRLPSNVLQMIQNYVRDDDLDTVQPHTRGGMVQLAHGQMLDLAHQVNPYESAFVLTRTNYYLRQLINYLISNGVPFKTYRQSSPWTKAFCLFHNAYLKFSAEELLTAPEVLALLKHIKARGFLKHGIKTKFEKAVKAEKLEGYYLPGTKFLDPRAIRKTFFINPPSPEQVLAKLSFTSPRQAEVFKQKLYHSRELVDYDRILLYLGTIHSVKGKEAETVYLFLDVSKGLRYNADYRKEQCVWFVGASRAIRKLVLVRNWFPNCLDFDLTVPRTLDPPEIIELPDDSIQPELFFKDISSLVRRPIAPVAVEPDLLVQGYYRGLEPFTNVLDTYTFAYDHTNKDWATVEDFKRALPTFFRAEIKEDLNLLLKEGVFFKPRDGFYKPI